MKECQCREADTVIAVEDKNKGAQDTTLWGSHVGDDGGGYYSAHSYCLWSVPERAV